MVKIGEMMMILDLHRQGLSVSAIARESGIDRKTVRKYIERGLEAPAYGPRKPRQAVIDPFTAYLRERVECDLPNTPVVHAPMPTQLLPSSICYGLDAGPRARS